MSTNAPMTQEQLDAMVERAKHALPRKGNQNAHLRA